MTGQDIRPALGADMAEGDAVIEIERGADGDGEFPHARLARVRQRGDGQPLRLDLDHRHIRLRIHAADFGLETAAVPEPHLDASRVLDHVAVGENVAVLADDDAGTLPAHLLRELLLELLVEVAARTRAAASRTGCSVSSSSDGAAGFCTTVITTTAGETFSATSIKAWLSWRARSRLALAAWAANRRRTASGQANGAPQVRKVSFIVFII